MQRTQVATANSSAPSVRDDEYLADNSRLHSLVTRTGHHPVRRDGDSDPSLHFSLPLWVNFKDKPVEHNPHQTGVVVIPDSGGGLIYQIEASAVSAKDQAPLQDQLLGIIEPISGEVSITKVETEHDPPGGFPATKSGFRDSRTSVSICPQSLPCQIISSSDIVPHFRRWSAAVGVVAAALC